MNPLRGRVADHAIVDGKEFTQNTAMIIKIRSKKDSILGLEGKGS